MYCITNKFGNQQSLIASANRRGIMAKLKVGQPDDKFEKEADAVADSVINPANDKATFSMTGNARSSVINMKCAACDEEEIQMSSADRHSSHDNGYMTPGQIDTTLSQGGNGFQLPQQLNQEMGGKIGSDFEHVRIHTDQNAVQMNEALNARAFTHGNHIYFNKNQYNSSNSLGRHLLAHELAHVVQQDAGATTVRRKPLTDIEKSKDLQSPRFKNNERLQKAYDNDPILRYGEENEAVKLLQQALIDDLCPLDVALSPNSKENCAKLIMPNSTKQGKEAPDGIFGDETYITIQKFQIKYGLLDANGKADGKPGRITIGKLDEIFKAPPAPKPKPKPTPKPKPKPKDKNEIEKGKSMSKCDISAVTDECAIASSLCKSVSGECKKNFSTKKDMDTLEKKYRDYVKSERSSYPNAADNLEHYLNASGSKKVMPFSLFDKDTSVQLLLSIHRTKFMEGAEKRIKAMASKPTSSVIFDMQFSSSGNAFGIPYTDLGLAVGGYLLCSSVEMKVTPDWSFGIDRYSFEFLKWDIQAFDCYNWDPGKSVPFVGNDEELCCLQNDGRGKHYPIQTDQWANTHPSKSPGKIFVF